MLSSLIVAFALIQQPVAAQPPATAVPKLEDASKELISTIVERSPDLLSLPDGSVVDYFRLRKARELTTPGTWIKVDAKKVAETGFMTGPPKMKDQRFGPTLDRSDHEKLPALVRRLKEPETGTPACFVRVVLPQVSGQPVYPVDDGLHNNNAKDLFFTAPWRELKVLQVVNEREVYAAFTKLKNERSDADLLADRIHLIGDLPKSLRDGSDIPGDLILIANGVNKHEDTLGAQRTVPSFQIKAFPAAMSPKTIFDQLTAGTIKLDIPRCEAVTSGGKTVYRWTLKPVLIPQQLRAAPKPPAP